MKKTMTCYQLGGACNIEFQAETFEEISEMSKKHGMEMFQKNDEAHLKAMQEMRKLSTAPGGYEKWLEDKRKKFESL